MTTSSCAATARALAMLAALLAGAAEAQSAVIPVTTAQQKISSSGGCSLQEAIFSANFDNNVAISGYSGSTPIEVTTQCVPGSGDDIIVLPAEGLLLLNRIVDDHINPAGPTATPIITSRITILAYGARLERTGSLNLRLFTIGNTGHLTLRRAQVKGFRAKGGSGADGGGGGLGAGGAIFVMGGTLVVEASTFEGNSALGGTGGAGFAGLSGGGGGLGGNGGRGFDGFCFSGGGGGGARGNGGGSCSSDSQGGPAGGGGGGTVRSASGDTGGFNCGASGDRTDGESAPCGGGGGSGGAVSLSGILLPPLENDGGRGNYGGGGGGGNYNGGGDGGSGGFGGGGGATGSADYFGENGGNGGFGGGGGAGNNGVITDGDPGNGGFFAGDGGSTGGGGGAGLGGAIFNESGIVDIRNTTLAGNGTEGGFSAKATDGVTGGGAIFSVNGQLTVLNTTISGNLAHIGGGILVVQHSENAPTSFVLENSIIANNGARECAITGFSIGAAFAGNLIVSNGDGSEFQGKTFIGCEGVVSSSDPQLGPLQENQGATPTMAIGSTSPAFNAADPGSSLAVDQRRQDRPAMGGFDIGAFELCLEGFGRLQQPCLIVNRLEDPGGSSQGVELTVIVNPAGGGTTVPAAGTREVALQSVVALKATPNAGFRFTEWSQNVTSPGDLSTTVFMSASQTVTANFAACECATDVTGAMGVTYGGVTLNPVTRKYVQTVTLTNNSAVTIAGPISLVLDKLTAGVTLANGSGSTLVMLPAGRPYINANTTLTPGQRVAIQLQFTNPGNVVFSYEPRVLAGAGSR